MDGVDGQSGWMEWMEGKDIIAGRMTVMMAEDDGGAGVLDNFIRRHREMVMVVEGAVSVPVAVGLQKDYNAGYGRAIYCA